MTTRLMMKLTMMRMMTGTRPESVSKCVALYTDVRESSNVELSSAFMIGMSDKNIDTDDCDNSADTTDTGEEVLIESPRDLCFDSRTCLFV